MTREIDRNSCLVITVAVLTRERPVMLGNLLDSWSLLKRPPNCRLRFLVVENDSIESSRAVVESKLEKFGTDELQYALETELGIPFGRNNAARNALNSNSDLLVFVDDDEVVATDWLFRLVEGYRSSSAVLIGAPLRINPLSGTHTWFSSKMHEAIGKRYRQKERRAARRADLNSTPGVTIVTNNWLAETTLFSEHGIWFDEKMRFTGGTDTKFYHSVASLGLSTGWVNDAYVYETIPLARLTFRYQYKRGKDQSNANFEQKIVKNRWARLTVAFSVPPKCVAVFLLAIAMPLTGGATLHRLARTSGWIAGRLGATVGTRSSLYENVVGE